MTPLIPVVIMTKTMKVATVVGIEIRWYMPLTEVVHDFNPSSREESNTGGNSSNTQYYAEVPEGRITSECKSQWLA